MKIIRSLVFFVAFLFLLVIIGGFFMPRHAHVERSVFSTATPEQVFPHVADLTKWASWSPWAMADTNMVTTFEGEPGTVGSKMLWTSEVKEVGSGSQVVTAVEPNHLVRTHLDFGKQGAADAYFEISPTDNGCQILWGFDTDLGLSPFSRYFGLMFDRMIGPSYEVGLTRLRTVVEAE
ncbi:MAG: SRPBCC family protein [Kiritimatiellae bacterium]|nr:SRPBCC family protein [Kiritimatiellia bacterium]